MTAGGPIIWGVIALSAVAVWLILLLKNMAEKAAEERAIIHKQQKANLREITGLRDKLDILESDMITQEDLEGFVGQLRHDVESLMGKMANKMEGFFKEVRNG
jgi:hypothetical protein